MELAAFFAKPVFVRRRRELKNSVQQQALAKLIGSLGGRVVLGIASSRRPCLSCCNLGTQTADGSGQHMTQALHLGQPTTQRVFPGIREGASRIETVMLWPDPGRCSHRWCGRRNPHGVAMSPPTRPQGYIN
jgi:hypothetical protein